MEQKTQSNVKTERNKVSWGRWLVPPLVTVISVGISLILLDNLAVSKTDSAREITALKNSLNHLQDAVTGLDNFAGFQTTTISDLADDTQLLIEETNIRIDDTNANLEKASLRIDSANTAIADMAEEIETQSTQLTQLATQIGENSTKIAGNKTALDALTTKVNNLPKGFQVTPTVSTTTGGGSISLAIKTEVAQTLAFQVEFRPMVDSVHLGTLDLSLAALYGTPPISLTAGTGLKPKFNLWWSTADSKYHLESIVFVTPITNLTANSTTTKTMVFSTAGNYSIIITPVFGGAVTTTGAAPASW